MQYDTFGRLAIAGALIALCPVTTAEGRDVEAFEPYVERPGEMEFSGVLTARPIQPEAAIATGTNRFDALRQNDLAGLILPGEIIEYVPETDEYIFAVPAGSTENETAQALMETGLFQYVEPDWTVYPLATPNDSRFSSQWHHPLMESEAAWDIWTGTNNVTVAINDTGIRTTHEDFLVNRVEGYNAVDRRRENSGGSINDINGHGTGTTGCAAPQGNNGVGIAGMGWAFQHRMVRVSNFSSGGSSISTLTHAMRWSADQGDRVNNTSYSGVTSSSVRTAATYCRDRNALAFWSAGNDGRNIGSPNRDTDDVLVVGASTSSDRKANFSAFGNYVDFFAPGANVYSATRNSNSSYGSWSGTSFSSPLAAGAAALIMSANPGATADEVEEAMKNGCDDIGDESTFGYGRVNQRKNLEAISTMNLFTDKDPLFRGDQVTFFVTNGEPFATTKLAYSLIGDGQTNLGGGIFVELGNAVQVGGDKTTNSVGDTFWTLTVPNPGQPRIVWFQAGQETIVSNVFLTQVNP